MTDYRLPDQTRIGWVELRVANLERSLRFYRDIVGLEAHDPGQAPVDAGGSIKTMALAAGGAPVIYLAEQPGAVPKPPRSTGLYHTAIRFPSREELAQALQRLIQARYVLGGVADHGVSEALYTIDPDGSGVELYTDRPRDQWNRQNGRVSMYTDSLDIQALLGELGGKPAEKKAPAGVDVGHVHLQVADLQASRGFYHDLLGLDITQDSYPGALFFSAGGYHHHVGINIWAGRGIPQPPPGAVGLVAFSLELPDKGSWQQVVDRVRGSGADLAALASPETGEFELVKDPNGISVALTSRVPQVADTREQSGRLNG